MSRKVVDLDPTWLDRAPEALRDCVARQQRPPAGLGRQPAPAEDVLRAWLTGVRREWGPCGVLSVVDDEVVGGAVYAPGSHLSGSAGYPTAPASPDAVLLASVVVVADHRGRGAGRQLVRAVARDLLERYGTTGDVRALEVITDVRDDGCVPPTGFCEAVGFGPRRDHPRHPRLRLDLRACVSWRGEVELAVGRLRAGVRAPLGGPHAQEARDGLPAPGHPAAACGAVSAPAPSVALRPGRTRAP